MNLEAELQKILEEVIPPDLNSLASQFARLIAEVTGDPTHVSNAIEQVQNEYKLAKALSVIAEDERLKDGSLINIEQGAQFGDLVIRNLAGGNIIKLNFNFLDRFTFQGETQKAQQLKAASLFIQIGKIEKAIDVLSKFLEDVPDERIFFERGKALILLSSQTRNNEDDKTLVELYADAVQDFTYAITLAQSKNYILEKKARYERFKILARYWTKRSIWNSKYWNTDLQWLLENTFHAERGEILYFELLYWHAPKELFSGHPVFQWRPQEALEKADLAVKLGFRDPVIFFFLALAHYYNFNFGIALKELSEIVATLPQEFRKNAQMLKFALLLETNKHKEAYEYALELKAQDQTLSVFGNIGYRKAPAEFALLIKYALMKALGEVSEKELELTRLLIEKYFAEGGWELDQIIDRDFS